MDEENIWTWLIQTNHKLTLRSWSATHEAKQQIIQRDPARNNSTWWACAPAWNSLLSTVKLVLTWLYFGIEWRRQTQTHLLAGQLYTASDSTCPADGVSLAMSKLLLIPEGICAGTETIQDSVRWISPRRNLANDSSKHGINITILYSSLVSWQKVGKCQPAFREKSTSV